MSGDCTTWYSAQRYRALLPIWGVTAAKGMLWSNIMVCVLMH